MWALRSLSPKAKTPYFLHLAATGRYFLFQFRLIIFAIFDNFFFQIPAFKAFTERSKVTFSPNAPLFWTKNWFLTQWSLILWDCVLTECPSLWKCEPYTRIHLILECPRDSPPRHLSVEVHFPQKSENANSMYVLVSFRIEFRGPKPSTNSRNISYIGPTLKHVVWRFCSTGYNDRRTVCTFVKRRVSPIILL